MAGYAALTSPMHIVKQVQEFGRRTIILDEAQIESLAQKVRFLQDFLESSSDTDGKEAEALENEIADSAYAAEDVIESYVIDRIRADSHVLVKSSSAVLYPLDEVIGILDDIKKRVVRVTEEKQRFKVQKQQHSMPTTSSSRSAPIEKISTVGLDEEVLRVMHWLTGGNNSRQIMSIVGMGGIGKTTLARSVFEKPLIVNHFDIHIWVTVSQQYNRHRILSKMASCLPGNSDTNEYEENQLGELLYKSLSGRRYVAVMDDMWDIEAWDMVRFFLPDNGNRSRVIVTTRQSNVAANLGPCCLKMELLDKDKSWDLFCRRAFGEETCPLELEEVGKVIAEKCKGLPLSIVVIAGLLANSSRTREYWKSASENINSSTLNSGDDEFCMKILYLSYNYLPIHLKPCFLYLGLFPEDHEIHVSQLVKLWVAEGFLKLKGSKNPEEVAEGYLMDLVDRNLVLVDRRRHNGSIKICRIHDLLRDLCVRFAARGRFLCLLKASCKNIPQDLNKERRIVVHEKPQPQNVGSKSISSPTGNHFNLLQSLMSASLCRSLMCDFNEDLHFPSSKFLRVFLTNVEVFSPETAFGLVNTRYLSFKPNWFSGFVGHRSFVPWFPGIEIPSTISLLWNVQTIVLRGFRDRFVLPPEFWFMSQLRHVHIDEVSLPEHVNGREDLVLENLETLTNVIKFRCDEEMVKRIPNIKKLKITYYNVSMHYEEILTDAREVELINSLSGSYYSLESLNCLYKLESLYLSFYGSQQQRDLLEKIAFPRSLKKLTLSGTELHWGDMLAISSLPNLEVLVLVTDSVAGFEWNPVEGGFHCLKVLKISQLELGRLNADETHFPALESLILENLKKLEEIPLGIGYISTLTSIDLFLCSYSSVRSSKKIVEEQESDGNKDIQVRATFQQREDLEKFVSEMELESLASNNFQVTVLGSYN